MRPLSTPALSVMRISALGSPVLSSMLRHRPRAHLGQGGAAIAIKTELLPLVSWLLALSIPHPALQGEENTEFGTAV
jgi:hypothetical protein